MTKIVSVIHLTDLHLRAAKEFDQDLVLSAFLRDLMRFKNKVSRPALLLFSGDLARGGDEPVYDRALDLLMDIGDRIGVDDEHIVICPGNHDVSRADAAPSIVAVQEWQDRAGDRDFMNGLYKEPKFSSHVFKVFQYFRPLSELLSAKSVTHNGVGYSSHYFRDLNTTVVSINTAMLSLGGLIQNRSDHNRLCLPERMLVEAYENIPKGSHVITLGHHPINYLHEDTRDYARRIITQNSQMYLSGHLHKVDPQNLGTLHGSCFYGQSGALYEWRDRWAGYAVYSFAPGSHHVRMEYRRWWGDRGAFGYAEDVCGGGLTYSTDEAREFLKGSGVTVGTDVLEAWRVDQLVPSLREECATTLSPVPISTSFVPPEFQREKPRTKDALDYGTRSETFTFEKLMGSDQNFVISAPSQSGKSTALRQWVSACANSPVDEKWFVPVLLSFDALKDYSAHTEQSVSKKIPSLPTGVTARHLLENGMVTVLIDDVDFSQRRVLKALVEFMERYPSCRYILASVGELLSSSSINPDISGEIPFSHVQLKPLKRRQLLTLIERHGVAHSPAANDQLLERVSREAKSLNVPLTPVTGSFLIQIFSAEPDRVLVNQATLIERYIELLLQKFSGPDVELGMFDFTLKRDLLSVITEEMVRTDEFTPYYNDVLAIALKYIDHYGFPFKADAIISHFIRCRILEVSPREDGHRIRFSLSTFSYYFAAWRMINSPEFKAWVLDDNRYLIYEHEVSFYAALIRNDASLVEKLFRDFDELSSAMWVDASTEVRSGSFMDDFKEPNPESTDQELLAIQDTIRSNVITDREREEMQEDDVVPAMSNSQEVAKRTYATTGDKWVAMLFLVSKVLKHMELIPKDEKRSRLEVVITGWLQFCTFSLGLVPRIAKDKSVMLNGVLYRVRFSGDEPVGEIARRISLAMPLAISYMATGYVGSEKLKTQLEEGIGEKGGSVSAQVLRSLLLADIGVSGIGKILRKAATGVRQHRFLEKVLVRKLYDVAIRFRLGDDDLNEVRQLATEVALRIDGQAPDSKQREAIITNLRRQRVLMGPDKE